MKISSLRCISLSFFAISFCLTLLSLSGCNSQKANNAPQNLVLKSGDDYQFATVSDIQLDGQGNIYVFDAINPRVLKFDNRGNYLGLVIGETKDPEEVRSTYSGEVSISPAIAKLPDSIKTKLMHRLNTNKLSKGLSQNLKKRNPSSL